MSLDTSPEDSLWGCCGPPTRPSGFSNSSSVTGLSTKLSYHLQEMSLIRLHIFSFLHD
jgi:hypothetical protein